MDKETDSSQTSGEIVLAGEQVLVPEGSALEQVSTKRLVTFLGAGIQRAAGTVFTDLMAEEVGGKFEPMRCDAFSFSADANFANLFEKTADEKMRALGLNPELLKSPAFPSFSAELMMKSEDNNNTVRSFIKSWHDRINAGPSKCNAEIQLPNNDGTIRLDSGCIRGVETKHIARVNYRNGSKADVLCNTEEEASRLVRTINVGGRMCRGPYQKYSKGASNALYVGKTYIVKMSFMPAALRIDLNAEISKDSVIYKGKKTFGEHNANVE